MPTSAQSVSQRLQHASPSRAISDEPTSKRVKLGRPGDEPDSSNVKGPLKQSAQENLATFVAKSFYGVKENNLFKDHSHKTNVKCKSKLKSSNLPKPPLSFVTGSGGALSPLDKLMMKAVALSPVKQAVLETCSLTEFRKMYRAEYEQLEKQIQMENCRSTRQTSKILKNNVEDELSDSSLGSSDDEVTFKIHDQGLSGKTPTKLVANGYLESFNNDNATPPRKNHSEMIARDKMTIVTRNVIHDADKQQDAENNDTSGDEVSDDEHTQSKGHSQADAVSAVGHKLSAPLSSERKFFKTRSPLVDSKKGGIVLGKGFTLKFAPKSLKTKSHRKKRTSQKKLYESVSPKTADNSKKPLRKEKAVLNEPLSPASGFTFAPGFLTPEKSMSKQSSECSPEDEENENLNVNKSNSYTYTINNVSKSPDVSASNPLSCSTRVVLEASPSLIPPGNDKSNDGLPFENGASHTAGDITEENLTTPGRKMFPIFDRRSTRLTAIIKTQSSVLHSSDNSPASTSSKLPKDNNNSQMIIDAGQKKFGVTQCTTCSMVYCHADPADEAAHAKFHRQLVEALRFPGWKKERVVQEYPEDLGRVILVMPDDPKYARKKVEEVNQLMGRELGFPDLGSAPLHPYHKVFFYIEDKQITSCCIAEPVQEGFRILTKDLDNSQESGQRPWCCSPDAEPVCVGISRLWVAAAKRQHGVATKLVDCVRQWFNYGSLIPKHKVAFSDPTPDGRRFAQKYIGTSTFLVYKYHYG